MSSSTNKRITRSSGINHQHIQLADGGTVQRIRWLHGYPNRKTPDQEIEQAKPQEKESSSSGSPPVPVEKVPSAETSSETFHTALEPTGQSMTSGDSTADFKTALESQSGILQISTRSKSTSPQNDSDDTSMDSEVETIITKQHSAPSESFRQSTPYDQDPGDLTTAKKQLENIKCNITSAKRPLSFLEFIAVMVAFDQIQPRPELADIYKELRREIDYELKESQWGEERSTSARKRVDELDVNWIGVLHELAKSTEPEDPGLKEFTRELEAHGLPKPTATSYNNNIQDESITYVTITQKPESLLQAGNGNRKEASALSPEPQKDTPESALLAHYKALWQQEHDKKLNEKRKEMSEQRRRIRADRDAVLQANVVAAIEAREIRSNPIPERSSANSGAYLSEEIKNFLQYQWKGFWRITQEEMVSMSHKDVKAMQVKFKGDAKEYPFFRTYFRTNIHANKCLTLSQKSLLLEEALSHRVATEIGAEPTWNIAAYADAINAMDELYLGNLREAYLAELNKTRPYDGQISSLTKLKNIVSRAQGELQPNDDSKTIVTAAVAKLGKLAPIFAQEFDKQSTNMLKQLAEFLLKHHRFALQMDTSKDNSERRQFKHYGNTYRQYAAQAEESQPEEYSNTDDDQGANDSSSTGQDSSLNSSDDVGVEFALLGKNGPNKRFRWNPKDEKCPLDNQEHYLVHCDEFRLDMTQQQRLAFAKQQGRCLRCISPLHKTEQCTKKDLVTCHRCKSSDHHYLLHPTKQKPKPAENGERTQTETKKKSTSKPDKENAFTQKTKTGASLQQVAVRLRNPVTRQSKDAYVIIDSGSSISLFDNSIAEEFGYDGKRRPVITQGVGGHEVDLDVLTASMTIESIDGNVKQTFPAHFCKVPTGEITCIDWNKIKHKFPQFAHLELPVPEDGTPTVIQGIIGNDLTTLTRLDWDSDSWPEIAAQNYLEPAAEKTRLGWTIIGFPDPKIPSYQSLLNGELLFNYIVLTAHSTEFRKPQNNFMDRPNESFEEFNLNLPRIYWPKRPSETDILTKLEFKKDSEIAINSQPMSQIREETDINYMFGSKTVKPDHEKNQSDPPPIVLDASQSGLPLGAITTYFWADGQQPSRLKPTAREVAAQTAVRDTKTKLIPTATKGTQTSVTSLVSRTLQQDQRRKNLVHLLPPDCKRGRKSVKSIVKQFENSFGKREDQRNTQVKVTLDQQSHQSPTLRPALD